MSSDPHPVDVVLLIRDLLFSSKAVAAAKAKGVAYKVVRDVSKLIDVAGNRLIADLSQDGALEAALEWKQRTDGHVTGFLPHVAGDLIARARELGIDRVMSNGAISTQMEDVVAPRE
ncbi:MAG: hypothetical protein QM770_15300 [Tepidisphaeraceae bacterium]